MSVFDPMLGNIFGGHFTANSQLAAQQNAYNQLQGQRLSNASALQSGLGSIAQPKPSNVTPIRLERTPEEIQAQLEARMAELEREAQKPERVYPCTSCRWHKNPAMYDRCYQPFVVGFDKGGYVFTDSLNATRLCGPEKALWEPIPTRWKRFTEWLARIIERLEGRAIQKGAE